MNNSWNKIVYKVWSPLYDNIFNTGRFRKARLKVFQDAPFSKGKTVLYTGVGTGADLEYIHRDNLGITAVDNSLEMLEKAKVKFRDSSIQFLKMDVQNLSFEDESFDFIVASLILSVVPNPDVCFKEMERVLKKDGQLIIFDKFAPGEGKLTLGKKLIRPLISVLGTDIGIDFGELYRKNNRLLSKMEDSPVMMNGMYRKIVLKKNHE
ncbi:class I SAM-dependent methyltransferase [Pseudalkalibacillus sp. A8]|uniref:class I SAM-dependent methyltransferase n=1 Tax=Pseudalkalibacillus sp. A8 TaxID=3382641 RepID=UPI0038B4C77B